ncbi:hypothetical protein KAR91_71215, partial [Candidatus Pacearchaeota archaeon]|nr:hypothetical protein [Candidatus Pacearchaeota archaeon]
NSMIILAKERTGYFMLNSITQVGLQLILTALLIPSLGVYGVIIGKCVGSISAQIGLFSIVRWKLARVNLSPPKEYWISQVLVISTGCAAWYMNGRYPIWAIALMIGLFGVFLLVVRFHPHEIINMIRSHENKEVAGSI